VFSRDLLTDYGGHIQPILLEDRFGHGPHNNDRGWVNTGCSRQMSRMRHESKHNVEGQSCEDVKKHDAISTVLLGR